MPDPHRIERELAELLSHKQYAALLARRSEFKPDPRHLKKWNHVDDTAAAIAHNTTRFICTSHPLLDPISVEERRGPVEFYRMFDGISHSTAGTLGRSWFERSVLQDIWSACARFAPAERKKMLFDFIQSANFVHSKWNLKTDIACMRVPPGASVVVVRGKGDWRALKADPNIKKPGDVMKHEKMMPIPGTYQCLIPLSSDMWISKVPENSAKWPFAT